MTKLTCKKCGNDTFQIFQGVDVAHGEGVECISDILGMECTNCKDRSFLA